MTYLYGEDTNNTREVRLDCRTVAFFANASDAVYIRTKGLE